MKKIYFSILTALAGLSLNAQTLTDTNHSPANGDMFSTWQCDSTGITAGASGAGALWNYSTIVTHSSAVNNYTANTNTVTSYPMPGVQVGSTTNNLAYYNSSATKLSYWGGNITVSSIAASLIYTASAVKASYPMALNTTSSSVTGGSITITTLNGSFTGNSSTIADGTGTLALANGTFTSVFRVVTTQTINFTVPLVGTGTVTQKNYDYYDVSMKNALFSITTSTVATSTATAPTSQTVVTRYKSLATGINENNAGVANLSVYPNPSSSTVNFATENAEAKNVVIYDVTGKLVEKQNLTDGKLKLDVSNYTTGIYMYSIIGNGNEAIKSGKITVSH